MSGRVVDALDVRSTDGLRLQATVTSPGRAGPPVDVVVLCHPHPLHGGTMHLPLLESVTDRLCAVGVSVVRFNFRGVGRSEGTWADGVGEVHDVHGAVAAAAGLGATRVVVGGWSFGGGVALRAVRDDAVARPWFGLAPALQFAGTPTPCPPASGFVVTGDADDVVDAVASRDWATGCDGDTRVSVLAGCDHSFAGAYAVDAGAQLADWVVADRTGQ